MALVFRGQRCQGARLERFPALGCERDRAGGAGHFDQRGQGAQSPGVASSRFQSRAKRARSTPPGTRSSNSTSAAAGSSRPSARRMARRSVLRRPRVGGALSSTRPPPSVSRADWSRRITRSPRKRDRRRVEHQLHQTGLARPERIALEHGDAPRDAGGAQVHVHRRPVAQGAPGAGRDAQFDVELAGGLVQFGRHQPVATVEAVLVDLGTGQIECAALSGMPLLGGGILGVDAAHPHLEPGGRDDQPVVDRDGAGVGRAGHDRRPSP